MSTIRVVNVQHTDATEPNIVLQSDGTSVFASGITISGGTNLTVSGTAEFASGTVSAPGITFIDDNNTGIYEPAADTVAITTAGAERLRVDSAGRLLVGKTTATDFAGGTGYIPRIQFKGTDAQTGSLAVSRSDGPSYIVSINEGGGSIVGSSATLGVINFKGYDGDSYPDFASIRGQVDGTPGDQSAPGRLVFMTTATSSANPTERMRIDSAGRLLLGTTTEGEAGADDLTIATAADTGITIRSGTSNAGNIFFSDATSGTGEYDGFLNYRHNERALRFGTAANERMRIDSSGQLGFGTTSPSATIHVQVDDPQFRLQRTGSYSTSAGPLIQFQGKGPNGTNYNFGKIQAVSSGANNAGELQFFTNSAGSQSERMRIDSSGNYTMQSSAGPTITFKRTGSNDGNAVLKSIGNNGTANAEVTLGGGINNAILFKTGSSLNERMRINSSGRVGIGESSPATKLHVNCGTDNNGIKVVSTDAGAYIQVADNSTTGETRFGAIANSLKFDVNGTERLRINSNGSVSSLHSDNGIISRSSLAAGTSNTVFIGQHSATSINAGTNSIKIYTNGNVQNTNNSYGSLSDAKLKENIVDASSQWEDIKDIRVRNYNFIEGETHTQIGVVAQEVEPVSPGLVYEYSDHDEEGNDLGTVTKSVNYSVLYMKAVKALQEAMDRIETLEAKVTALEAG